MSRNSYSQGKRQREVEKARRKREKAERRAERREQKSATDGPYTDKEPGATEGGPRSIGLAKLAMHPGSSSADKTPSHTRIDGRGSAQNQGENR